MTIPANRDVESGLQGDGPDRLTRRAFLHRGALVLAGTAAACSPAAQLWAAGGDAGEPVLRVGMLTDVHYADRATRGTRHYRESIAKIRQAVARFHEAKARVALELGDFIDAADSVKDELGYLKSIEAEYAKFHGDRHHVLGNHCVYTLTKQEFLDTCGAKTAHYSFDQGDFHFVVLDACYRNDGVPYGRKNYDWTDANVPPAELEWLQADLKATDKRAFGFVHQRLDVANHYGVKNAPAVRRIFEQSGKVLAVFMGHNHINDYKQIGGIHYCTLMAVVEGSGVENNAYAIMDVFQDGSMRIDGFRKQGNYQWGSPT